MKKWILFLAIAIAVSLWIYVQLLKQQGVESYQPLIPVTPAFVEKRVEPVKKEIASVIKQVSGRTPLEITQNYIQLHAKEWQLQPHHELKPEVLRSAMGIWVHYQVYQDGIIVSGAAIRFHLSPELELLEVDNKYQPYKKGNKETLANDALAQQVSTRYGFRAESIERSMEKPLYFPNAFRNEVDFAYKLENAQGSMVVRASDGQLLAMPTGRSEFSRRPMRSTR